MKAYILLPVALLAGLVIGGLGPRSELDRVREELKETQRQAKGGRPAATMSDVSSLLGIERQGASASSRRSGNGHNGQEVASTPSDNPDDERPDGDASEGAPLSHQGEDAEDGTEERKPRNFDEDLNRAIELWQTRVAIARNTFVDNARLNHVQTRKFDTIVDAMNVRIGTRIDEFAKDVSDAETVQPEAGIRLVNDITDSMVTAYDEMDQTMPAGWRRNAGERFTMTDFIDPEVARPLADVQGKMGFMAR